MSATASTDRCLALPDRLGESRDYRFGPSGLSAMVADVPVPKNEEAERTPPIGECRLESLKVLSLRSLGCLHEER